MLGQQFREKNKNKRQFKKREEEKGAQFWREKKLQMNAELHHFTDP